MSSTEKTLRAKILKDIGAHLKIHGEANYSLVWKRYPQVFADMSKGSAAERKFFRWVEKVKKGVGEGAAEARVEAAEVAEAMARVLPAAPSPSYIATHGTEGRRKLDFLAMLHTVVEDIETLRLEALQTEGKGEDTRFVINPATGKPKIKLITAFDNTIRRRLDTIETAIKVMQEVYDLQRMETFYATVVDIIAEEVLALEPEVAHRIMARLKTLNDAEAMTPFAEPTAQPFDAYHARQD